jgi:hypothetical protein
MATVQDYQEALRKYHAAETAARDMIALIKGVAERFWPAQFPSFLGWQFGINDQIPDGQRFDPKANIDLSDWPSVSDMKEKLQAWHAALKRLDQAWHELPRDSRVGFHEPPSRMDTRGY